VGLLDDLRITRSAAIVVVPRMNKRACPMQAMLRVEAESIVL